MLLSKTFIHSSKKEKEKKGKNSHKSMLPLLRKPKASSECFDAFLHYISGNGYIEAGELDDFLAALHKETSKQVQIMSRSYISSLLLHYVMPNGFALHPA